MVKLWAEILSQNRIFLFYNRGIWQYSYYYSCFIIEEYPSILTQKWRLNPHFFVCANIRIKLTFYFYHYLYHYHHHHSLVCILLTFWRLWFDLLYPDYWGLFLPYVSCCVVSTGFILRSVTRVTLIFLLAGLNYQTTWPASWEICRQVRKQQLEQDMGQQIGSK